MVTSRLGSRLSQQFGKSVSVTSSAPITFNAQAAAERLAQLAIGEMQRNAAAGKTTSGGAMAGYSESYKENLRKGGEGTNVDLILTGGRGGLLQDLHATTHVRAGMHLEIVVTVGTGRSPEVRGEGGHMKRTGKMGPPHDLVASWLHNGSGHLPARPWLGLTDAARKRLARQITQGGFLTDSILVARRRVP